MLVTVGAVAGVVPAFTFRNCTVPAVAGVVVADLTSSTLGFAVFVTSKNSTAFDAVGVFSVATAGVETVVVGLLSSKN